MSEGMSDLLRELTLERFGPRPRKPPVKWDMTPAEIAAFEIEHERAQERLRRQILEDLRPAS